MHNCSCPPSSEEDCFEGEKKRISSLETAIYTKKRGKRFEMPYYYSSLSSCPPSQSSKAATTGSRTRLTFPLFSFIVTYIVLSKRLYKTIGMSLTKGENAMYELLVLALLMHWPLYAYLIAEIANHILGPWERISRGTLSSLLTKLEQA